MRWSTTSGLLLAPSRTRRSEAGLNPKLSRVIYTFLRVMRRSGKGSAAGCEHRSSACQRTSHPAAKPCEDRCKRTDAVCLLQKLRLEVREVEIFPVRLNFALCVHLQDADAVHEENISRLGLET